MQRKVVQRFIATSLSPEDIFCKAQQEDSAKIYDAGCRLAGFLSGKGGSLLALRSAREVDIQGLDTGLCILFLCLWARASMACSSVDREHTAEAWAVLKRAKAFLAKDVPNEISAYLAATEAHLMSAQGRILEQDQLVFASVKSLKKNQVRRSQILLDVAPLLAVSGRLGNLEPELDKICSTDKNPQTSRASSAVLFVNAVETCRIEDAALRANHISAAKQMPINNLLVEKYMLLNDLIANLLSPVNPSMADPENSHAIPNWLLALKCLANGSIAQALKWARVCEKNSPSALTENSITSFNLLRAEIAEKNYVAAQRLMDLRASRGNIHFLDDFFSARIEILKGNNDAANALFSSAIAKADNYRAGARLEFELNLAAELPRNLIFRIARALRPKSVRPLDLSNQKSAIPSHHTTPVVPDGINRLIGYSTAVTETRRLISQFAQLDVPVLLTGETGTGKELVARAIHEESPRSAEPFIAVNCAAISESLLESELFGHEKGAFTGASLPRRGLFEEAGRGTILLDEIGDITPRLQATLLRILETSEFRRVGSSKSSQANCRVFAATNADISVLAEKGRFRKDLLYRLRRLEINILPLRERPDDILPLALHFLNTNREKDAQAAVSEDLKNILLSYSWPGNVRELRNAIERMRLMNSDKLFYTEEDIDISNSIPDKREITPTPALSQKMIATPIRVGFRPGKSPIRRLQTLKMLFTKHKVLTRDEIIKHLNISPNTATQDLKKLANEEFIKKIQPTASPRSVYFELN